MKNIDEHIYIYIQTQNREEWKREAGREVDRIWFSDAEIRHLCKGEQERLENEVLHHHYECCQFQHSYNLSTRET